MKYNIPFDSSHPRCFRSHNLRLFDELYAIEVGHNCVPNSLKWTLKRDIYILHYVVAGKGTYMNKNFTAGDAYIVIPNELETIEADAESPYETYWIIFKGTKTDNVLKYCNLPQHNSVFEFNETIECAKLIKQAIDMTFVSETEEAYFMQGILYNILSLHVRHCPEINPPCSSLASRIKDFIDCNYFNNINLGELALQLNYSRSHLYRIFKTSYGMSPNEYLINLRIEKSKALLDELSVSETAYSVGFNNPLYFSRIFHQKIGVSPTEYKKQRSQLTT